MKFLEKIQNLPESKRKTIFWLIVIILGLSLFALWVKNFQQRLKNFREEKLTEELKLPSFQELEGIPKIEMPQISEEELKKLEEMLKASEEK